MISNLLTFSIVDAPKTKDEEDDDGDCADVDGGRGGKDIILVNAMLIESCNCNIRWLTYLWYRWRAEEKMVHAWRFSMYAWLRRAEVEYWMEYSGFGWDFVQRLKKKMQSIVLTFRANSSKRSRAWVWCDADIGSVGTLIDSCDCLCLVCGSGTRSGMVSNNEIDLGNVDHKINSKLK